MKKDIVDALTSDIPPDQLRIIFGKGSLILWRLIMTAFIMYAFGLLAWLGPGFADAGDVRELRVEQLAESIEQNRIRQCTAMTADARQFYGVKVQELRSKYRAQTGQDYQLIDCRDIIGFGGQ